MNPLKVEGKPCEHPRFVLDAEDRSVHCSQCGVVVDAFDVLLEEAEKNAKAEGFLAKTRGHIAHAHNQLEELHETLKRTRRSATNESRKLDRLIARRKALEGEVASLEPPCPQTGEEFELGAEAAAAADRFATS